MRTSHVLAAVLLLAASPSGAATARSSFQGDYPQSYFRPPEPSALRTFMMVQKEQDREIVESAASLPAAACVGGMAAVYPCRAVDMEAFLSLSAIGDAGSASDIWGWTDPSTGREYAIVGLEGGTSFVDVTDPRNPVYLGILPTPTSSSVWHDIKVYADHAFIVSEAGGHGMQVFNLDRLRRIASPPVTFVAVAHYTDFGSCHNLVINEDSGFAYGVGSGTCGGGLHMVDIRDPRNPQFAGCFAGDGYTHDAQCVNYCGPDSTYNGREICFAYNEDTLTVVDVTDKAAPIEISRTGYPGSQYTHQGWLTEDMAYAVMDDELDESRDGVPTTSHIWDVSDLDAPFRLGTYVHGNPAIDHNQYIRGNLVFQSNYRAGLRILDASCIRNGSLSEVGFFDVYPADDDARFSGTWSNYPYFPSGTVVVTHTGLGLFVLRPRVTPSAPPAPIAPDAPTICVGQSVSLSVPPGWAQVDWSTDPPGESGDGATGTTISVSPGATTKYMASTDEGRGCGSFSRTVVTVEPAPTVAITASRPSVCAGETVDLSIPMTGWDAVVWSTDPPGQPGDGATTEAFTVAPTVTTRYRVEATSTGLNCPAVDEVEVVIEPPPPLAIAASRLAVCEGGSVDLSIPATGWDSVLWTTVPPGEPGDGETAAAFTVTPLRTTRFRVDTTLGGSCPASDEVEVTLTPRLSIEVTPSRSSVCVGDTVTLDILGGWSTLSWRTIPAGQPGDGAATAPLDVAPTVDTQYQAFAFDGPCNAFAIGSVSVRQDLAPAALGNVLKATRERGGSGIRFYWRDLAGDLGDYQVIGLRFADGPPVSAAFEGPNGIAIESAAPGLEQVDDVDGQLDPAGDVDYRVRATSGCRGTPGPV